MGPWGCILGASTVPDITFAAAANLAVYADVLLSWNCDGHNFKLFPLPPPHTHISKFRCDCCWVLSRFSSLGSYGPLKFAMLVKNLFHRRSQLQLQSLIGQIKIQTGLEGTLGPGKVHHPSLAHLPGYPIRAEFQEGNEDSNFSVFRVRRFSEWPEPLTESPFL